MFIIKNNRTDIEIVNTITWNTDAILSVSATGEIDRETGKERKLYLSQVRACQNYIYGFVSFTPNSGKISRFVIWNKDTEEELFLVDYRYYQKFIDCMICRGDFDAL